VGINGQWIGSYQGNTIGKIVVDIDERAHASLAYALVHPDDKQFPSATAQFEIPKTPQTFHVTDVKVHPINP
jgi:FRG domain